MNEIALPLGVLRPYIKEDSFNPDTLSPEMTGAEQAIVAALIMGLSNQSEDAPNNHTIAERITQTLETYFPPQDVSDAEKRTRLGQRLKRVVSEAVTQARSSVTILLTPTES